MSEERGKTGPEERGTNEKNSPEPCEGTGPVSFVVSAGKKGRMFAATFLIKRGERKGLSFKEKGGRGSLIRKGKKNVPVRGRGKTCYLTR